MNLDKLLQLVLLQIQDEDEQLMLNTDQYHNNHHYHHFQLLHIAFLKTEFHSDMSLEEEFHFALTEHRLNF